jgi:adenosylcobinamide kinase/adenosylcobinamide-phosphate guanylyltransferase
VITLVLGGARSGKSQLAEALLLRSVGRSAVTYIATAAAGGDAEFAARIAEHRARRDAHWQTVELGRGGDLATALRECPGPALVDSIGTWVAGHPDFAVDLDTLVSCLQDRSTTTVLVSDEVGWGVHPETGAGRAFRDALGTVNLRLAEVADEAVLVVAGRVLELPRSYPREHGSRG